MPVRDVLQYPHPVLREMCKAVTPEMFDNGHLTQIVTDLLDTMAAKPGTVGLAAPQIAEPWQVFVMDSTANTTKNNTIVVVNPTITSQSRWKFGREGCLSFPEYLITLKRARKITSVFQAPSGEEVCRDFLDFEAVIFQHEADHLAGILFIDLARSLDSDLIIRS